MQLPILVMGLLAAVLFMTTSMAINLVFLASIGRTTTEAVIFGAVSIAADLSKAILPVMLATAWMARRWCHVVLGSVMLIAVVGCSLASGMGFAAMTRGTATALREAGAHELAAATATLTQIERKLSSIATVRAEPIVAEELAGLAIDRQWQATAECRDAKGPAARQFCAAVHRLRVELAETREASRLAQEKQQLISRLTALRRDGGATPADPQVTELAVLAGVSPETARLSLTLGLAIVLELGSVGLLLLLVGPTIAHWQKRRPKLPEPVIAAKIPDQPDRLHWQRRRGVNQANGDIGGEAHAR